MLKFCIKVFRTSLFPNPMMDLVRVWHDDRYWSKILHSAIPNPIHDLKVKIMDLELSCLSFTLKFLGPHCFQTLSYICFVFDVMIDAGPKFYVVWSPTQYMTWRSTHRLRIFVLKFVFKFLQFLFFVKPLMDLFMFGMVIETGQKFYMVPFPTHKVTDSEFLCKSFMINVLQFQFFFDKPSVHFILDETALSKHFTQYPSQSQCMTLRSRSETEFFFG